MIQPEFRPLVDETLACCKAYLGERFLAAYLHGSVETGDAVAGVSDLDLFVIIRQEPDAADRVWLKSLCDMLAERYDVIDEAHITLTGGESLRKDRFSVFALTHNAALLDGADVASHIGECDEERYLPDKRLAKMRLGFARQCLSDALEGKQPVCTGPLPQNTFYAARKLARYFVVIEGAYFLMSIGKFRSFHPSDVLGALSGEANAYAAIIELTRRILGDPLAAGVGHESFIRTAAPLVDWMFRQIDEA